MLFARFVIWGCELTGQFSYCLCRLMASRLFGCNASAWGFYTEWVPYIWASHRGMFQAWGSDLLSEFLVPPMAWEGISVPAATQTGFDIRLHTRISALTSCQQQDQ